MRERIRYRLLTWWTGLVSRHPVLVLLVAGAGVVLSLLTVVGWIGPGALYFQSNRNDLLSKELEWNQRFIDWQDNFPGTYDLVIAVDAADSQGRVTPERARGAEAVVEALARRLDPKKNPHVEAVVWGAYFSPRAVQLEDLKDVERIVAEALEGRAILENETIGGLIRWVAREFRRHFVERVVGAVGGRLEAGDIEREARQLEELRMMLGQIGRTLEDPGGQRLNLDPATPLPAVEVLEAENPEPAKLGQWRYLVSDNGRLYFLRVTPHKQEGALNAFLPAIRNLRQVIEEVRREYPGFDIGLTGIEVVEADETDAATWDSTWTSALAAVLIAGMLVTAFHSWRLPMLAVVSLGVGVAWSFGFATVAVGHLQVISVVFTVMLLGLGVAYGIHLAARYERVRHEYPDTLEGFEAALRDTFRTMGPGIFTGAITTAAAFMTTLVTDFKGVAEMGLIAGVGVMLCFVAMFSVFPALLRLLRYRHRHVVPMRERWVHLYEERWSMWFCRRPGWTVLVGGILTVASVWAVTRMSFDYDLLKLQPPGVDSVQWAHRIARDGGESIWTGISIVSGETEEQRMAEARLRREMFLKRGTIRTVRGIGLLFPEDEDQKRALLEEARRSVEAVLVEARRRVNAAEVVAAEDLPAALEELRRVVRLVGGVGVLGPAVLRQGLERLGAAVDELLERLNAMEPAVRRERLAELQVQYQQFRRLTAMRMDLLLDPSPLRVEDLPEELLRPYIGVDRNGQRRYVLEVCPRLPSDPAAGVEGPLDPDFLPYFIADMRAVDPEVTGVIVQIYNSGKLIRDSYVLAGILALGVVFLLVLVDFRRVGDALLCLLPVAVGFAVTFGLMWVIGAKINPANIIVLPLMFGIGVDAGVHLMHRYRMDPVGRPLGLTAGTGKGIMITGLTTVIGFGAMALASHRGIRSLGIVLASGIALTTLVCLIWMPACLELISRWKEGRARSGSG